MTGAVMTGHTCGVKVQKVQKVQRVQRVADCLSNGQPTIGRPFYVQAKGQLWLTCAFYAEYAHEGS